MRYVYLLVMAFGGVLHATVINTSNPALVAAFQSGATVNNFESISGRTPQSISAYTSGDAVSTSSFIFDQIAGVKFSVGGAPGTNEPALYQLTGGIAGDAHSGNTVLGPVDFDFTTKFNSNALLEIFFPTKVSRVGFWLNPSLGNALLIAADTNFAFSGVTETTLDSGTVTAGNFVGIDLGTASIGGFKVIALGSNGFSIDDFTVAGAGGGGGTTVPEPGTVILLGCGLIFLSKLRRWH